MELVRNPGLAAHRLRLHEKLVCVFMRHGKKAQARRIIDQAFTHIAETTNQPGEFVFLTALTKISPALRLRGVVVGKKKIYRPHPQTEEQRYNYGVRMLVKAATDWKSNTKVHKRLAKEIIDASNGTGKAYRKKLEMDRQILVNRVNVFTKARK